MSISTLGIVKFRSDREQARRIANQTRNAALQTRNAARAQVVQNQVMIAKQRDQIEAQVQGNGYQMARDEFRHRQLPPSLPPGWYQDPVDDRALCWWDWSRLASPNQALSDEGALIEIATEVLDEHEGRSPIAGLAIHVVDPVRGADLF